MRLNRYVLLLMLALAVASACGSGVANADAARKRGLAALDSGRFDVAITELNSAIRLNPKDADALNSLGNAYASNRQPDLAMASYDSSIKVKPDNAFAYKNRGAAWAARDDFDRAIKDFDQAIRFKPDYPGAYNSRGFAHHLKGEYELAVADYDQAIKFAPENPAAYRNRANARFILGRFAGASTDLERALRFHDAATKSRPSKYLDETGAYTVLWLHAAKARAGVDDSTQFATNALRVDSTKWPGPVIAMFNGRMTADQLVAWAAHAEERLRSDQHCGSEFFAGQAAMLKNQAAEARKRFEETRASCSKRYTEHAAATAELTRLGVAVK